MAWFVRQEGSRRTFSVPSAADVLAGLQDGNWLPTDEVRGPADEKWQPIELHPAFADAAAEIDPPKPEGPDETHLDMNPLIDVCLVLLIFFILTITYASLERAISIPEDTPEQKGPQRVDWKDIKDRVFLVTARMDGERPVVKVEKKEVPLDQIAAEIKQVVESTGRREMVLDIDKDVPWGVETAILDAAAAKDRNGNRLVHNIINNYRRK
jgi:biopolymer transport protein ExbD